MSDKEIIKALEICSRRNGVLPCYGCPAYSIAQMCMEDLMSDALDLINRQKEEIEALVAGQETLQKHIKNLNAEIERLKAEIEEANDVIVLPCKVGDTVYVNPYTWDYFAFSDYKHCFIHSEHFLVAEVVSIIKTRKQNLIKLKIYNRTTCTPKYKRYPISSIGITVFLTKEEAEKALKERENNG